MRDDLEYWKIIIDVKAHSASFLLSFLITRAAGSEAKKKETNYWERFLNSCYREDLKYLNLKFIKKWHKA